MAKLTRVTQQVFGLNGNPSHYGVFGSKAAGSPINTLDPASIQSLAAFSNDGWLNAIVGANKQPLLEDMNGLFRVAFYQLAQIFQDGIPVWDGGTNYFTGSIARQDGTSNLYASAIDNNEGNALPAAGTSNGFWTYLNPAPIPPGTIVDYAGGSVPFGFLGCDGEAYPQSTFPNLYAAINGQGWDTFNGQSAPASGYFRIPNLHGFVTAANGGALGLSVAGVTGELTHTLTVAEMPIHGHGGRTNVPYLTPASLESGPYTGGGLGGGGGSDSGATISNAGGGAPHNNVQPTAGVIKMIKF